MLPPDTHAALETTRLQVPGPGICQRGRLTVDTQNAYPWYTSMYMYLVDVKEKAGTMK